MGSAHNVSKLNSEALDVPLFFQWFKCPNGYLFGAGLYSSATVVTDTAGNALTGWSPGAIFIDTTNGYTYKNKTTSTTTTTWALIGAAD